MENLMKYSVNSTKIRIVRTDAHKNIDYKAAAIQKKSIIANFRLQRLSLIKTANNITIKPQS